VDNKTVNIHILDKDYQVSCPSEESDALINSAKKLNSQMQTIRNSGNVIGVERIAVMAALNLTYEISKIEKRLSSEESSSKIIQNIERKLSIFLENLED
jgi:cell division protein ZapA|tara:strand:+ start:2231 stop:2527 length:297 start_codon:yes stop_codon:yes gene_type:complete